MPDIKGVDLASFQGEPGQWSKLPGAQGIHWAAVKFTEVSPQFGVGENPDAKDDWDYLFEHKLGRVAYLFAHPSISIQATIGPFKAMTDRLGLLPDDGICVDLEVTDGMSPAAVAAWAQELFANLARIYGRRPLLYTFVNFIEAGNCHGLEVYHAGGHGQAPVPYGGGGMGDGGDGQPGRPVPPDQDGDPGHPRADAECVR